MAEYLRIRIFIVKIGNEPRPVIWKAECIQHELLLSCRGRELLGAITKELLAAGVVEDAAPREIRVFGRPKLRHEALKRGEEGVVVILTFPKTRVFWRFRIGNRIHDEFIVDQPPNTKFGNGQWAVRGSVSWREN